MADSKKAKTPPPADDTVALKARREGFNAGYAAGVRSGTKTVQGAIIDALGLYDHFATIDPD